MIFIPRTNAAVVLSIEPGFVSGLGQGSFFSVSLTVTGVTDLDGWESKLTFTPGKLAIADAVYPGPGDSPFCVDPGTPGCYNLPKLVAIDNVAGTVSFGATSIPIPASGPSGTGPLAMITFEVLCNSCSDTIGFAGLDPITGDDPTKLRSVTPAGIVTIQHTRVPGTFSNLPQNAPTASFTITPGTGAKVNDLVTFDASASRDPDGSLVQYNWNFGDGTRENVTTPIHTHRFATAKTYTITLVVVDNADLASEAVSKTYPVQTQPQPQPHSPSASFFVSQQQAPAGTLLEFNAEDSADDDGTIVSYTWDFGDGTPIVTETVNKTMHAFNREGTFTVTLTVTDDDGLTGSISHPVTVGIFIPTGTTFFTTTNLIFIGAGTAAAAAVGALSFLRRRARLKGEESREQT